MPKDRVQLGGIGAVDIRKVELERGNRTGAVLRIARLHIDPGNDGRIWIEVWLVREIGLKWRSRFVVLKQNRQPQNETANARITNAMLNNPRTKNPPDAD